MVTMVTTEQFLIEEADKAFERVLLAEFGTTTFEVSLSRKPRFLLWALVPLLILLGGWGAIPWPRHPTAWFVVARVAVCVVTLFAAVLLFIYIWMKWDLGRFSVVVKNGKMQQRGWGPVDQPLSYFIDTYPYLDTLSFLLLLRQGYEDRLQQMKAAAPRG